MSGSTMTAASDASERSLIGDLLLDAELFGLARTEGLVLDDFANQGCRLAFETMETLVTRGWAISVDGIMAELPPGTLAAGFLDACVGTAVNSDAKVPGRIAIVRRESMLRRLGEQGQKLLQAATKALPIDVAREAGKEANRLLVALQEKTTTSEALLAMDKIWGSMTGELKDDSVINTGIGRVNKLLEGGLRRTDFTVIAGRTSQGKTALACNILHNAALNHGKCCVMYSYEMSEQEVSQRLIAIHSGIALSRIRQHAVLKDLDAEKVARLTASWQTIRAEMDKGKLDIIAASGWTIDDVAADVLRRSREQDLAVVCIDYLQLVAVPGDLRTASRATQVSYTTAGAKQLSQQARVSLLGLSQLNRGVEARTGDPQLSDLRESGSIEQDANQVIFVFDVPIKNSLQAAAPNGWLVKRLHLAKNRNGAISVIDTYYYGALTLFTDAAIYPPGVTP